jgi:hypothetical protein
LQVKLLIIGGVVVDMRISRDFLSLKEMEDIISILKKTKDYCSQRTDDNDDFNQLTEEVNISLTILIKLSQRRRSKLMKLFSGIERERNKVLSEMDVQNLAGVPNSKRAQKLEKLINEYLYLNEGVKRSRSATS